MSNKQEEKINFGAIIASWVVSEYEQHERPQIWYILAFLVGLALLAFSYFTDNFLFAVIILIFALIMVLHDGQLPGKVKFTITEEGIIIGKKFIDYDEIKDFSVIYKPREEAKNLYFEFNGFLKHRLTIPLEKQNPLQIREHLLKYLPEDLERKNQPLSEGLAKMFKI
jgi:hypothetical protein